MRFDERTGGPREQSGGAYKCFGEAKAIHTALPMNLRFFDGEKTEKATPRKKTKAREEGQVAKSAEIGTAFLFIAVFAALGMFGSYIVGGLQDVLRLNFTLLASADTFYEKPIVSRYIAGMFGQIFLIVLPVFAVTLVIGLITNIVQVGWHPTAKLLKPKFSKLNPLKGMKRLFSFRVLIELIKSILKFVVILLVIFDILSAEAPRLHMLLDMGLQQAVVYVGDICLRLGINVGMAYLLIALADYAYVRWKHAKDLRMSKQEVKEEYKNIEGNPQIKGKIRQKMREASMRRMMQDVPTADVIITNPTHFAVALRYDTDKSEAPMLVAKGTDHLAQRIKALAKENNVAIVENKPLARALYATVDVGREIPPELYQTVAEVLAYVYKLKNPA